MSAPRCSDKSNKYCFNLADEGIVYEKLNQYIIHVAKKFGIFGTKFLRCTGYLNSIKNPIKQDLLQILVLVRQQNFLNC